MKEGRGKKRYITYVLFLPVVKTLMKIYKSLSLKIGVFEYVQHFATAKRLGG